MSVTVFRNCRVFDGVSPDCPEGVDVVVEGNRIREIAETPVSLADSLVLDVAGRTLMPGLIDAHVHVVSAHLDSRRDVDMPASYMTAHACRRLKAMLDRGFTTVRDEGGADFGLKRAVEQGVVPGPRLFICGLALSQTGGHGDLRSLTASPSSANPAGGLGAIACVVDGVDEVRRAVRNELRKGADQIKLMISGGAASDYDPIDSCQFSADEVRAAVEEAATWKRYVTAHSYTPQAIRHGVECGVRSIEHGNLIDEATARLAAEKGVYVVPTLVVYEELERRGADLGIGEANLAKVREINQAGIEMLGICQQAGVKLGLGTDLLGELLDAQCHEFLIQAGVLGNLEALRSGTSVNAEILQMDGRLGVIAEGALADVIVVDGDPLADLGLLQDEGAHLLAIMKDGVFHKNLLA
jgi:imidazolonepropionase-like amidohydrolase